MDTGGEPGMTNAANAAQSEAWNGDNGLRWVAIADRRDAVLAPVAEVLFAAAKPAPGDRVLDVGCGCGATTLIAAARVGAAGSVVAVDISDPMLGVARARAAEAGVDNVTFVHGDAQTDPLDVEPVDLVISRFGTMFFADPVAAFTNIGSALRPGGRLCLATWQPLAANEWLTVPDAALSAHTDVAPPNADGPGMFGQSDPEVVTATLRAAGFADVTLQSVDVVFDFGDTVDAAADYLVDGGPVRARLDGIPAGPAEDAALVDLRTALAEHLDPSGVRLRGAIWLVNAEVGDPIDGARTR